MTASPQSRFFPCSSYKGLLQILVVFCAAVAGPIINIIADGPAFFVNRRATPFEIVIFVALVLFAIPLLLWIFTSAIGALSKRLSQVLHFTIIGVLLAFLILPILAKGLGLPGMVACPLALAVGGALGLLSARTQWLQTAFLFFSPLLILTPLTLFRNAEVQSLLFPKQLSALTSESLGALNNNVVVVVFDELSLNTLLTEDAQIDAARFPHFAELAAQSTWYRNTTSVNQFTPLAVPAILSGLFPKSERQLPTTQQYPINLFTLLSRTHEVRALESFTKLCPDDVCHSSVEKIATRTQLKSMLMDALAVLLSYSLPTDLNLGNPDIDGKWGDFWNEATADWDAPNFDRGQRFQQYRDFIGRIKGDSKPTLYFLHMILPHMPYQFSPDGVSYPPGGIRTYVDEHWIADPALRTIAYQQYLGQVGAADNLLGRLIAKMKEQGIWDSSLLVIAADHGVSFEPNTYRRGHPQQASFYQDVMSVPFFLKLPGQTEGEVSDRNVETIDILPSIVDALHGTTSSTFDGSSVLSGKERPDKHLLIGRIPGKAGNRGKNEGWADHLEGTVKSFQVPSSYPKDTISWKYALPGYRQINKEFPYYIGAHPELLNTPLSSLAKGADSELRYSIKSSKFKGGIVAIKPNAGTYPCLVQGTLTGPGAVGKVVGVAVNGQISGVTTAFSLDGGATANFSFLVSDRFYKVGNNTVDLFELQEASGPLTARRILP